MSTNPSLASFSLLLPEPLGQSLPPACLDLIISEPQPLGAVGRTFYFSFYTCCRGQRYRLVGVGMIPLYFWLPREIGIPVELRKSWSWSSAECRSHPVSLHLYLLTPKVVSIEYYCIQNTMIRTTSSASGFHVGMKRIGNYSKFMC